MPENNIDKDDLSGERVENNSPDGETKKIEDTDVPSFGEIWVEKEFVDTELFTDNLDREMIIKGFEVGEGGYGPYVILDVSVSGGTKRLRTSSLVVIDQLQKIVDKLPIRATPIQRNGKDGKKFLSLS